MGLCTVLDVSVTFILLRIPMEVMRIGLLETRVLLMIYRRSHLNRGDVLL